MDFVSCTYDSHGESILEIFNEAILKSTALYDYHPRTMDNMVGWFKAKKVSNFPVIGAVSASGKLLGFASYGSFRAWPAYKYSVEHSVYIHQDHRGCGLGKALMQKLIEKAIEQEYHLMIGGIDAANSASISLHETLGFNHAGTITQAGFKFDRWLDLAFYQLILSTPHEPIDG